MTAYVRIISGRDTGSVYHITGALPRPQGVTEVGLWFNGEFIRTAKLSTLEEICADEFRLLGGKYQERNFRQGPARSEGKRFGSER